MSIVSAEQHSGPTQAFKIELPAVDYFWKSSILDTQIGSEYAYAIRTSWTCFFWTEFLTGHIEF